MWRFPVIIIVASLFIWSLFTIYDEWKHSVKKPKMTQLMRDVYWNNP